MTITVDIDDAKARLSELVARAEAGEEIVIARDNAPVATVEPAAARRRHSAPPSRTFWRRSRRAAATSVGRDPAMARRGTPSSDGLHRRRLDGPHSPGFSDERAAATDAVMDPTESRRIARRAAAVLARDARPAARRRAPHPLCPPAAPAPSCRVCAGWRSSNLGAGADAGPSLMAIETFSFRL